MPRQVKKKEIIKPVLATRKPKPKTAVKVVENVVKAKPKRQRKPTTIKATEIVEVVKPKRQRRTKKEMEEYKLQQSELKKRDMLCTMTSAKPNTVILSFGNYDIRRIDDFNLGLYYNKLPNDNLLLGYYSTSIDGIKNILTNLASRFILYPTSDTRKPVESMTKLLNSLEEFKVHLDKHFKVYIKSNL